MIMQSGGVAGNRILGDKNDHESSETQLGTCKAETDLKVSYNKTNQMHQFLKFILGMKFYMLRTVPLSIIRSMHCTHKQRYMSYSFADSLRAGSGWNNSILILLASCLQTCITYQWCV